MRRSHPHWLSIAALLLLVVALVFGLRKPAAAPAPTEVAAQPAATWDAPPPGLTPAPHWAS